MFDTQKVLSLVEAGFTAAEIRDMVEAEDASPEAGSAVVAPPKAKAETPAWIVQRGINKAARRKLAAELRAKGVSLQGAKGAAAWAKAKKAAGIA